MATLLVPLAIVILIAGVETRQRSLENLSFNLGEGEVTTLTLAKDNV